MAHRLGERRGPDAGGQAAARTKAGLSAYECAERRRTFSASDAGRKWAGGRS